MQTGRGAAPNVVSGLVCRQSVLASRRALIRRRDTTVAAASRLSNGKSAYLDVPVTGHICVNRPDRHCEWAGVAEDYAIPVGVLYRPDGSGTDGRSDPRPLEILSSGLRRRETDDCSFGAQA